MGFRSSLKFFRPGRAALMTVDDLRHFTEALRQHLGLRDNIFMRVGLRLGKATERALNASHGLEWNAAGTLGKLPPGYWGRFQEMDGSKSGKDWSALWPKPSLWRTLGLQRQEKAVHAASMNLGGLTEEAWTELGAKHPTDERAYVAPDTALFSVGPCSPYTLASETLEEDEPHFCHGCFSLSFSGNGYFQWQPIERYWEAVRDSKTVVESLRICRERLPTSADLTAEAIAKSLGKEPFLNRAEYREGDWVVSISESG